MGRVLAAACLALLVPAAARAGAADLEPYRGTYAVAGRILLVHAPADGVLAYVDDGRTVRLDPVGRDVFRSPLGETLTFRRDPRGRPVGLSVAAAGRRTVHGVRVRVHAERRLEATNGAATLSGAALLPPGGQPLPGAVIVAATPRQTRASALALADALARRGVAAAVYDGRAAHAPTRAPGVPLHDLAGDALAVRRALAALPGMDGARVGLVGVGRGSRLLPLAAAREPAVAFVVSVSGSGLSLAAADLHARRRRMERAGLPPRAVEAGVTGLRLLHDLRRAAWRGLVPGGAGVTDDPDGFGAAAWSAVRPPVLLIAGGRDGDVPAEAGAASIAAVLARAGHRHTTLRLFPEADHDLQVADSVGSRPAPGYLDLLAAWIRDGGRSAPAQEAGAPAAVATTVSARSRPGVALLPAALAALATVVLAVAGASASRRGAPAPAWLLLAAAGALGAALVGSVGWLVGRLGRGDDAAAALAAPLLEGLALAFLGTFMFLAAAVAATWRRADGATRAWLVAGVAAAAAVLPVLVQFGLAGR